MKKFVVVLLSLTMIAGESYASSKKNKLISKGKGIGESMAKKISGNAQDDKKTGEDSYKALDKNSAQTKDDSQKGSTTAKVIQVAALGVAIPSAVSCTGGDFVGCGIAAVMFGFASQAGKSSKSFGGAADHAGDNQCTYTSNTNEDCAGPNPNPYTAALTPGVINEGKLKNDEAKIKENLSKGGFTVDVDSGKIKGPNGEMDLNDPASLEAGLGSEAYAKVMSQLGDIEKNAKAKVDQLKLDNNAGFDEGGGGADSIAPVAYGQDGAEGGGGGYAKNTEQRKPANTAGLTKNFNGEPIGVAADSIFAMMSRRYQLKKTQKTFFGPVPEVQ